MPDSDLTAFLGGDPFAKKIARGLEAEGITTVEALDKEFNKPISHGLPRGWAVMDARGVGTKALERIAKRLDNRSTRMETEER